MDIEKAAILVKKSALEFDRIANTILKDHDLTSAQYKVLKYIYGEDNVRIVDLERFYSMSHATTIGIVKNLDKKGLVEYRENPTDARSRYIVPSELAEKRRPELEDLGAEMEKELTKNLTDKERQRLIQLLKQMLGLDKEDKK